MSPKSWMGWTLGLALWGAAFAVPVTAAESSLYHKVVMKGSIIESGADGIYLCIGTNDGASVGQELDVIRVKKMPRSLHKGRPRFSREHVGRVRIDEVVDEHFARATVVSGEADKGDIVELEKP